MEENTFINAYPILKMVKYLRKQRDGNVDLAILIFVRSVFRSPFTFSRIKLTGVKNIGVLILSLLKMSKVILRPNGQLDI